MESDPKWRDVARAAADVWADGMVAYAETLTRYYPNDADRNEFVSRVKRDMLNLDYHMVVTMYG
jgi:hypothetical protein